MPGSVIRNKIISFFSIQLLLMALACASQADSRCLSDQIILTRKHTTSGRYHLPKFKNAQAKILKEIQQSTLIEGFGKKNNMRSTAACAQSLLDCRKLKRMARQNGFSNFLLSSRYHCEANKEVKVADTTPNDPDFSMQWGHHQVSDVDMDSPAAWSRSTGLNSVVVGLIDTGVDYTHPDISGNIWVNPGESVDAADNDSNGYIDDFRGINIVGGTSNVMDDNGHGTHVAGIIGATGNNSVGICGVAWDVQIATCKALASNGTGNVADTVACINYFTDLKVNRGVNIVVTNNSWTVSGSSAALDSAIQSAQNAGILFVTAAGNNGVNIDSTPYWPASSTKDNVIAVAAIASDGSLAGYSNYGTTSVDIGAPGSGIYSTIPGALNAGTLYGLMDGTSMAAAHVTGSIAVLASYVPSLNWEGLRSTAIFSGKTLPLVSGLHRNTLVNLNNLLIQGEILAAIATPTPIPTATRTPTSTPTLTPTATATSTLTFTRTATATRTETNTPTITSTRTNTATRTSTATITLTRTPTITRTPTVTRTVTPTRTVTATRTMTATKTPLGGVPTAVPTAAQTVPVAVLSLSARVSKNSLNALRLNYWAIRT